MINYRLSLAFAVAALLYFGAPPDVAADFQVTLRVGSQSTTITDSYYDSATGATEIDVNNVTLGGYTFKFTLAATNTPGGGGVAFIDASTARISGSGAALVQIIASANDFTEPVTPPSLLVQSAATALYLSGTKTNNRADVSFTAYADKSNELTTTGEGTVIGTDSGRVTYDTAANYGADLADTRTINSLTGPYALSFVLEANFLDSGANVLSLDGTVAITVPVPGSFALVLTAVPALAVGAWARRRLRAAPPAVTP